MALRELFLSLGADTSDADKKIKGLDEKVSAFGEKLKGFAEGVAAAFALEEIREFVKSFVEAGSVINDTAERLGLTSDELQRFQYAGKIAGVAAEEVATSFGFLNKAAGEAATGSAEQAKTFAALGVSIKDAQGHVRPLSEIALAVSDGMGRLGNQSERAAYAVKLFGRSGQALLPLLGKGSEEARALFEEFDELGGGMSREAVKGADAAGDALDRLNFATHSLGSRLASMFFPAIAKVATWLAHAAASISKFTAHTNVLQTALISLSALATGKALIGLVRLVATLGLGGLATAGWVVGLFALYAIFDDVFTLLKGGDSVIGRVLDNVFGKGTSTAVVEKVRDIWNDVKAAFKDLLPRAEALFKSFGSAVWKDLTNDVHIALGAVQALIAAVERLRDLIGAGVATGKEGSVEDAGRSAGADAADVVNGGAAKRSPFNLRAYTKTLGPMFGSLSIPTAVENLQHANRGEAVSWQPQGARGVVQNNPTTIHVTSTGDPKATADAVGSAISDVNKRNLRDAHDALFGGGF